MIDELLQDKRIRIALGIVGALFVVGLVFSAFRNSSTDIDTYPEEGSSQDYTTHARIVEKKPKLFTALGGDTRYDSLSQDLYSFGKTAYAKYKENSVDVIGFSVDGDIEQKGEVISFKGNYGASENSVNVVVEKLPNLRIKLSITDTKTNLNIDTSLRSNSKMNTYIATLPKTYDGFSVEYSRVSDKVFINLFERDPTLLTVAYSEIKKIVDDGSFSEARFQVTFPVDTFGQ